jgi:hypothetical protein
MGTKVDVFDLGPCSAGDRIIVSIKPSAGSPLDPTTAIFDAAQELVALNDDAALSAGRVDSFIDVIVGTGGAHFYLATTRFFFASTGGAYDASVEIQRGSGVPAPQGQRLLLNFAAGSVVIPDEGSFQFDAFDAQDIDAAYAGLTAQIKTKIVDTVRQNFAATGMQIFTSDDAVQPAEPFSTIHFGSFSSTKFGVAQAVDAGNRDCCDDGIVFTDDFDKPFSPRPSADGIAVAIGNVAAHEAGHLLGLNHVADITALMDTTGAASTLLADQEFKTAPLAQTIFPFGMQNDMALLNRVIPK